MRSSPVAQFREVEVKPVPAADDLASFSGQKDTSTASRRTVGALRAAIQLNCKFIGVLADTGSVFSRGVREQPFRITPHESALAADPDWTTRNG